MSLLIRNGHIVDPANKLDGIGWIHVSGSSIAGVGMGEPPAGIEPAETIDAQGMYVTPGFIDLHVHLREPGQESKETIETGSRAAVAGGYSTIVCMPNTDPAIDTVSMVKFIHLEANRVGLANVLPSGTVSRNRAGGELAEIGELVSAGVVAITDDGSPVMDAALMRCALEYSRMFNIPVMDHCEDISLNTGGVMNEGFYSTKLGLRGIPSASEDVMIARNLILADYTGGSIHIQHMSTAGGVRMIRNSKARGVKVTCEVTPHHLALTEAALCEYETNFKMSPPLRTEEDRLALIEGLADGTIDAIATDHAPHTFTDKDVEFDFAPNGIIGMESALPVVYTKLVKEGSLSLGRMVEALTSAPAAIIGCSDKGKLVEGADADITIWDAQKKYRLDVKTFKSKSRNCPFDGWDVYGSVAYTLAGGEIKYRG
jgi:dihydroorotase